MQTFTTTQDVIDQHVAPALGEHASDFDQLAIAQAITYWQDGKLTLDEDADFWAIAAEHETTN
ncbi:hypothetical protein [Brachybacterium sp. UMB0905]|uniref:hypothetical protein n=1 Tax=Brachybacterium sp. UMB0905 TaxID=2069310 RepID=UPI000C8050D2|nr:hypothetical protein [Brachybacterium sp. UMB0905]PMC76769.1 hypothetical protein CJ197_00050 [Brachybacterium sp. UMB0905]